MGKKIFIKKQAVLVNTACFRSETAEFDNGENKMKNILAVFGKQIKDTLKNKSVLIQFLMFLMMTLLMQNTIKLQKM